MVIIHTDIMKYEYTWVIKDANADPLSNIQIC